MAERGARPLVPAWRRGLHKSVGAFFTPLLPDDYLELINPLWSTQELRGRIESVRRETPDAATVLIRPGWRWPGHRPGQYLRIGVVVGGVHHWRAYSLTSEPGRSDGCIAITPKRVAGGTVSAHLVDAASPGTIVRLGGVEGDFVLPHVVPERLLFISAGSGITPIMSMLRFLSAGGLLSDAVLLHSARTTGDVVFGAELRELAARHPGFRLHERHTAAERRMEPCDLELLCPDWRDREAFASGPASLLDGLSRYWEAHGNRSRLHSERFGPAASWSDAPHGQGGAIRFRIAGTDVRSDGATGILAAGEQAGLALPYGCRMGICHTCVGRLCSGQVRDLRNGRVSGRPGEMVRTCINAPEGDVEIAL